MMTRWRNVWLASAVVLGGVVGLARCAEPQIVSVEKIWDEAKHSAFTDLIRFQGKWFCTFREGSGHIPGTDGTIRVLVSDDGSKWQSAASIAEQGIDLRDPKLSVTPDGRLMIVAGGSTYTPSPTKEGAKELTARQPRVLFSSNGSDWTAPQKVLSEGEWLWRVTWNDGRAYGVAYRARPKDSKEEWLSRLYSSADGVHYDLVTDLKIPDRPNETTLRFLADGQMVAMVRRETGNQFGWIGSSRPPYTDWNWSESKSRFGGPNFIVLPDGSLWAGSRNHTKEGAKTVLARILAEPSGDSQNFRYEPVVTFPSGGDTSYPGLVWSDGLLWMSYYSSHEGKTSIYLAKIRLGE